MMATTTKYVRATVSIYFPAENPPSCSSCPLMGAEAITARKYCRRSGEILLHTEHQIGYDCPLNFDAEPTEEEADEY